jgi:hypothetical protein
MALSAVLLNKGTVELTHIRPYLLVDTLELIGLGGVTA